MVVGRRMSDHITMTDINTTYRCNWTRFWQEINPLAWKGASWLTARFLLKTLKNLEIKNMLELGGGSGLAAKYLAQKLGAQLTLMDNNPGAYEAFKRFSNYGEYLREDFFSFQTERRWDLVFSLGVIEHFQKEKRIESIKIHRNLSSKYVLIAVPANSWLRRNFTDKKPNTAISFEKLYVLNELKKEFQEANLEPLRAGKNIWAVWLLSKISEV